jgi:hypothetical protein
VFGRRLRARERRALLIGGVVSVVALAIVYGVLPFARRWQLREDEIATETERVERLRGLVAHEDRLRDVVAERTRALAAEPQRLLAGRTPALAAASLQSRIQEYADQSRVTVSRLDVVGAPNSTPEGLPAIPATVSAVGDIYGMIELIVLLQRGPVRLELTEVSVRPNPALRGDLLQMTLTLSAPYVGS